MMAGAHPKPRPSQSSHSFCHLNVFFFRNVAVWFSTTIYNLEGFVLSVSECAVLVLDQDSYVYSWFDFKVDSSHKSPDQLISHFISVIFLTTCGICVSQVWRTFQKKFHLIPLSWICRTTRSQRSEKMTSKAWRVSKWDIQLLTLSLLSFFLSLSHFH